MIVEEWRPVVGYEEKYEVSSLGRVRSLCHRGGIRNKPLLLSNRPSSSGYVRAHLHDGTLNKCVKVHRVVALAFIPNPDNLPQVNHIDECKTNNAVDNLEWCTALHNTHHSIKVKYSFIHGETNEVVEPISLTKFCKERGLTQSSMSQVHNGKAKHHKGWINHE